ncbi:MAG: hypothetical protein CMM87_06325 [Rickettsiales bacterium]|nr:hypothetical protein [Rickettsiales bacterium]|tara:strand:- start:53304 stop:53639 length:336 start_codon:yes stop_codon:yes gene_type:complete
MAKNLTLKILTSQSQTEKKDIKSILVPGLSGDVEVRPGYANMIIALRPGTVNLKPSEEKVEITQGGLLTIRHNHCTLCLLDSPQSTEDSENKDIQEIETILDANFFAQKSL